MKTFISAFVMFQITFCVIFADEGAAEKAGQWEYRMINYEELFQVGVAEGLAVDTGSFRGNMSQRLDLLGKDGWELCAYISEKQDFVFKRPVAGSEPDFKQ